MPALASLLLVLLMLAGCVPRSVPGADSPWALAGFSGGSLALQQPLRVPAGRARVFLQDGAMVSGFDQYRAHCALEIRSVQHAGFDVAPGVFRITRVQHSLERVVDAGGRRYAALQLGMVSDWGAGSSAFHEGFHLWLDAAGQPGVMRLSCYGAYAQPSDLQPPSLTEIREVLGDLARITGP